MKGRGESIEFSASSGDGDSRELFSQADAKLKRWQNLNGKAGVVNDHNQPSRIQLVTLNFHIGTDSVRQKKKQIQNVVKLLH